jgi:hypothetical protein
MTDELKAVLDRIEQAQRFDDSEGLEVPANATPLDFLQAVYRSPTQPMNRRLKASIGAANYVHPKFTAVAQVSSQDFAALLEQRIRRNAQAQLIAPNVEQPAVNLQSPPAVADKRFRRA